jgi:hypothetical protein
MDTCSYYVNQTVNGQTVRMCYASCAASGSTMYIDSTPANKFGSAFLCVSSCPTSYKLAQFDNLTSYWMCSSTCGTYNYSVYNASGTLQARCMNTTCASPNASFIDSIFDSSTRRCDTACPAGTPFWDKNTLYCSSSCTYIYQNTQTCDSLANCPYIKKLNTSTYYC